MQFDLIKFPVNGTVRIKRGTLIAMHCADALSVPRKQIKDHPIRPNLSHRHQKIRGRADAFGQICFPGFCFVVYVSVLLQSSFFDGFKIYPLRAVTLFPIAVTFAVAAESEVWRVEIGVCENAGVLESDLVVSQAAQVVFQGEEDVAGGCVVLEYEFGF